MVLISFLKQIKRWLHRSPRPALNGLDRKLERYLNFRGGFFIEAGANDGYSQSNTYYLEKKLGWRGVLVEGIPELFDLCRQQRPGSKVYNCALVSQDFNGPTITMHYAGLMSMVDGALKSEPLQVSHLRTGMEIQRIEKSYSVEVPARTLEAVLDDVPDLPQIDFLSLDVEGHELSVLDGLNLSKYRPIYILVEARFFEEVDSFLIGHGYTIAAKLSHHDYLYESKPGGAGRAEG